MSAPAPPLEAIWHEVECGAYATDLPLWTELANAAGGPSLELGAGTGRVAIHLAAAGLEVVALDSSATLLEQLATRAGESGLRVETVCADARELDLGRSFAAILAPMQFLHLLGGPFGRGELLSAVGRHLAPGGTFAAALLAEDARETAVAPGPPPLPDVRELDGWVYSSQPLEVAAVAGGVEIRRLRQVVSPAGEMTETRDSIRLDQLTPGELEAEAAAAGLRARERIALAPTDDHVGSVVCVFEAPR